MSLIPITTLTPAKDPPTDKAIRGVVTLFWPYSSSTRQCAFLLADPDFRLRSKQGQVRVRFTGASAEAVAKSHAGIGDEVVLALEGARWEEDPEASRTPGRSVDGELLYRRKLGLVVKREAGDVRVDVDAPSSPPRAVEQDSEESFVTPLPKAVDKLRGREVGQGYAYTSPAFAKRLRLSEESFLNPASNPFAVEDMDVDMDEEGAHRRISFGRGINWRYAAKTPSPTKETPLTFDQPGAGIESPSRKANMRNNTTTLFADDGTSSKMLPPPRPRLQLSSASPPLESATATDNQEGPSTPKLLPVKSPDLPLPSPFPTDRAYQSQFGSLVANSTTKDETDDSTAPLFQSQDDETMSEAPQPSQRTQQDVLQLTPPKPAFTLPATPARAPLAAGFSFGFDGAAAASPPVPQEPSPQDVEKKRVMAQTFRSLFGFTGSSQAQSLEQPFPTSQVPPVPPVQQEQAHPLSELEQRRLSAGNRTSVAESVTLPEDPASAIEASGSPPTTMPDANVTSTPEVAAPSAEFKSPEPPRIPELEETTASEAALPQTEFLTSQTEAGIEDFAALATQAPLLDPKSSPPSQKLPQKVLEIIEIESSSEDEDEDDQASQRQEKETEVSQTSQARASQDSFRTLRPERTDDALLESFLEPEHLYPTLPAPQKPVPASSEFHVKSASPEVLLEEASSQQATMTESSRQQPSYPSLPLSPSNSQSIQGMASQEVPDLMPGLLPPTPQLTQAESSASYLQGMLGTPAHASQDQRPEDAVEDKIVAPESEDTYRSSQQDLNAVAASEPHPENYNAEFDAEVKVSEPMDQSASTAQVDDMEGHVKIKELAPIEQPPAEALPPPGEQIETGRITRAKAKKAAGSRVSIIPDAISSYFSPKRSSTAVAVTNGITEPSTIVEPETNGHQEFEFRHLASGFSTALSYFTPLSHLHSLLNPSSSQQALGSTNTVDVLAVVTYSMAHPVQAKAGPRDHYTIFRITDNSLANASVRVEVFRPYKTTLPSVKEGNVILLRAFAVKSRKRRPYLISSDASAWCVFSFSEPSTTKGKPKWALKAGEDNVGVIETISGPPVEFGDEERQRTRDLREWWDSSRVHDGNDDEANGVNETGAAVGSQPVAAKL